MILRATLSWLHQQRCKSKFSVLCRSCHSVMAIYLASVSVVCECFPAHGWERVKPQMVVTAQTHARHTITDRQHRPGADVSPTVHV